jgi:hypothetical protein
MFFISVSSEIFFPTVVGRCGYSGIASGEPFIFLSYFWCGERTGRDESDRSAEPWMLHRRDDTDRHFAKVNSQNSFFDRGSNFGLDQVPAFGQFTPDVDLRGIDGVYDRREPETEIPRGRVQSSECFAVVAPSAGD